MWEGWDADAVVGDRQNGVWADRAKIHATSFRGEYHDLDGMLPFPRSPQGRPVLVQAGQSRAGIALASRYADLVFSGPSSLDAAIAFRTRLREATSAAGRDPDAVRVTPALMLTLGGTEDEAHRKARELDQLSSADFRWQNALFTAGLDPDDFDPDEPLPPALWTDSNAPSSRMEQLLAAARASPTLPLRALARNITGGAGQLHFIGTPDQLVEYILDWQDSGAADGFTLMGSTLPGELRTFVDHVVPVLQRQGRFREGYRGRTLREHLTDRG